MENKENELPTNCPHCGEVIDYLNHKHHLYMYCDRVKVSLDNPLNFPKKKSFIDGIKEFTKKHGDIFENKSYEQLKYGEDIADTNNLKWNYFSDNKYPLNDWEIIVYSNKKNKHYIEFTDSEFSVRCINRNYIKWAFLRHIEP